MSILAEPQFWMWVMIIPIVLIILSAIWFTLKEVCISLDNWFCGAGNLPTDTLYNYNTNTYVKENKVNVWSKKPATILDKERCRPPRASFFGKIDGVEITEDGNFEEKYLTTWELRYWKEQKAREEAVEAGILNEIDDLTPI